MDKDEVIELMHEHGFSENVEEIYEHGEVKYSVSWKRNSDQFQGPTVVSGSATEAFVEAAYEALNAIADKQLADLKAGKLPEPGVD